MIGGITMSIIDDVIDTFKNISVGTVFNRTEIINKVCEKHNRNKSSIIPSDYCFNRWNEGISDTDRICLFEYLYDTYDDKKYKYLGESYPYNGKVYHFPKHGPRKYIGQYIDGYFYRNNDGSIEGVKKMFNSVLLRKYVDQYKSDFHNIRFGKESNEIYKWQAVKCFKDNWNINALNFAGMLKTALSKTYNLLNASYFFAYAMISKFVSEEPEIVRGMFRTLYDENKNLVDRVNEFSAIAKKLNENFPDAKSDYQGTRAASIYLWLMYPEKYYVYQWGIVDEVVSALEADYDIKSDGKPESMIEAFKFYDEIRKELAKDDELVQLNVENGVDGYVDETLNTLTVDVAFYIYKQNKIWEPSLKEYNPLITKQHWQELLYNEKIFTGNALKVMKGIIDLGGSATCKQLAENFGGTYNFYNSVSIALAKRVQKETSCPMPPAQDGDSERYWPILYVGRNIKGEKGVFEWKLRDELKEALVDYNFSVEDDGSEQQTMFNYPKNLILYGPPGTGKTHNTVNYAVAIVDNRDIEDVMNEASTKEGRKKIQERYKLLRKEGLIEFCTFHQSYSYEEFIEGIKPNFADNSVGYKLEAGAFKVFCNEAEIASVGKNAASEIREQPTIWKVSLMGTGENLVRKDCMDNNHIRICYGDELTESQIMNTTQGVLGRFVNDMQIGDIVLSCYTENEFDAVGVVTGECKVLNNEKDYKQSRAVKWLVKNIREDIKAINDGKKMTLAAVYRFSSITLADVLTVVKKYTKTESDTRNRVFIIDEINRGNISKIFGELITLIEDTKRIGTDEEMRVRLPYSGEKFGVPNNVYLLGTMNTADRSIALIDTALRRRFKFVEMQPNAELLKDIEVEGVKIKELLEMINKRIEVLYDREHTIGHSFFMGLSNASTIADLAEVFECSVIPLLKEYFYNDFERIAAVLGDNGKSPFNFFDEEDNVAACLKNSNIEVDVQTSYKFQKDALKKPEAYKKIYE